LDGIKKDAEKLLHLREALSAMDEECETGVWCVAAPIRHDFEKIVAGISVSDPAARMTDAHIHFTLSLYARRDKANFLPPRMEGLIGKTY
jgi:DNA-binding IclR family transcriptional regulator